MTLNSLSALACCVLIAQGCASETRLPCAFVLSGPLANQDGAAWRGAQLAGEMPKPDWVGQRKFDWSSSRTFARFDDASWPKEAKDQTRRWNELRLASVALPDTAKAVERTMAFERELGAPLAVGFAANDHALEGARAFCGFGVGGSAPMLVVGVTDPAFPADAGEGAYLVAISDDTQAVAAAEFIHDHLGGTCLAVVDSTDGRMRQMVRDLTGALGGMGGAVAHVVDLRASDLELALREAMKDHPSARSIYAAIGTKELAAVLPGMARCCGGLPIIGPDSFDHPELDRVEGLGATEIIYSAQAWFGDDACIEATRFASYYRLTYGEEPTAAAALAFDAARIAQFALVKAVRAEPGAAPRGEALAHEIDALLAFPGATGRLSYRDGPVPVKDVWMVRLKAGKRELAASSMVDRRKADPRAGSAVPAETSRPAAGAAR